MIHILLRTFTSGAVTWAKSLYVFQLFSKLLQKRKRKSVTGLVCYSKERKKDRQG